MKNYVKNLTFKLQNVERTEAKYRDYKKVEFSMLMNSKSETIRVYLKYLSEDIQKKFYFGTHKSFYESLDLTTKTDMKFLKTNINHACQELNQEFIESIITRPNKNKIACFAIKFYLKYYTRINKLMHDTLEKIIKEWNNEDI